MKENIFEAVYDSAQGLLVPECSLSWVTDLFTTGSCCDAAYGRMTEAYDRLRTRLGVEDEDRDVEMILNCQEEIRRALCRELFRCGMVYQQMKDAM